MELIFESAFKKGKKALDKKHYDFSELEKVIRFLTTEQPLPNKYRDHSLSGDKKRTRDCHIDKNVVLLYRIENKNLVLVNIGNHKDLLGK